LTFTNARSAKTKIIIATRVRCQALSGKREASKGHVASIESKNNPGRGTCPKGDRESKNPSRVSVIVIWF
jgi:hypothetical protein